MSQGKTSTVAHVERALFLLILNVLLMNFLNQGTCASNVAFVRWCSLAC